MALHFTLNPLFESMSGVVSRRRLLDGRLETIVATKRGTINARPIRKRRSLVAVKSFSGDGRVMVMCRVRPG